MSVADFYTSLKLPTRSLATQMGLAFFIACGLFVLPISIIDWVSHITHLKEILLSPIDSLGRLIRFEFPHSVLASLSPVIIGCIYVGVLLVGFGWYTWSTTEFYRTKRTLLANAIIKFEQTNFPKSVAAVEPASLLQRHKTAAVTGAATAAAGAATIATVGVSVLPAVVATGFTAPLMAVAPPLAAAGPPGWIVFLVAAAAAAVAGAAVAVMSAKPAVQLAVSPLAGHDAALEAQRKRDQAEFEQDVKKIWAQFDEREQKAIQSMTWTGLFLVAIIIYNFAAPFVAKLFS
jgi:hypothetical protein